MAKAQPLKDPANYLKNLIAKKGDSEHYATVFHGANLMWDPREHSHSDTYDDTMVFLAQATENDSSYKELIWDLIHRTDGKYTYKFEDYWGIRGVFAYVSKEYEGENLSATFAFPTINASKFSLDVEILSHISLKWAKIAGRSIGELRVFIDQAFLRWEDMENDNLLGFEQESD